MPFWNALSFQDSNSTTINQFLMFNDHTIIVVMVVTVLTGYSVIVLVLQTFFNNFILEENTLESVWTIFPSLSLLFVAVPSINILYLTEEILGPSFSLNIMGHQWYWSYEMPGFFQETDSFLNPSSIARLIMADPQVAVPMSNTIRLLVSSQDVIHSWALPSAGVNVDANPGRINQSQLVVNRPGLLFGQCSEICGANHSFIPITLNALYNPANQASTFLSNMWNNGLFIPQTNPLSWTLMAILMISVLILTNKSLSSNTVNKVDHHNHPINNNWTW